MKESATHVRREVVPPHVARMLAEMLTAVTEGDGTGVQAAVPGFRVAGKTATAQKADPATGKYSEDRYVASFVGFIPAEKPRLVIAIVLEGPHYRLGARRAEQERQRAQAIQEELRRRGADRGRPQEELDYIDRLLRRF